MNFCCYHVCECFGDQTSLFEWWFPVRMGFGWLRCDPLGHYRFWVFFGTFGHFQDKHKFKRTGTIDKPIHLHTSTHTPEWLLSMFVSFYDVFLQCSCSFFTIFWYDSIFHPKKCHRPIDFSRKLACTVSTAEIRMRDHHEAFEPLCSPRTNPRMSNPPEEFFRSMELDLKKIQGSDAPKDKQIHLKKLKKDEIRLKKDEIRPEET